MGARPQAGCHGRPCQPDPRVHLGPADRPGAVRRRLRLGVVHPPRPQRPRLDALQPCIRDLAALCRLSERWTDEKSSCADNARSCRRCPERRHSASTPSGGIRRSDPTSLAPSRAGPPVSGEPYPLAALMVSTSPSSPIRPGPAPPGRWGLCLRRARPSSPSPPPWPGLVPGTSVRPSPSSCSSSSSPRISRWRSTGATTGRSRRLVAWASPALAWASSCSGAWTGPTMRRFHVP